MGFDEAILRATLHELVVGCVVTTYEHRQLTFLDRADETSGLNGWRRYDEVGISVVDMTSMKIVSGPMKGFHYDLPGRQIVTPTIEDIKSGRCPALEDE